LWADDDDDDDDNFYCHVVFETPAFTDVLFIILELAWKE